MYVTIGDERYHYHTDHLGSVRAITDEDGDIVNKYEYTDPWGSFELSCPSESIGKPCIHNRYTYTGREWDEDAQLYHYRARWYDPSIQRFISEDPIFHLNSYIYTENKPFLFIDPFGLDTDQYGLAISGGLGGGFSVSVGVAKDSKGHLGLYGTAVVGAEASIGGLSIMGEYTHTNAPTIFDLRGPGSQIGGCGGIGIGFCAEHVTSGQYVGGSISGGLSIGSPLSGHAYVGATGIINATDVELGSGPDDAGIPETIEDWEEGLTGCVR